MYMPLECFQAINPIMIARDGEARWTFILPQSLRRKAGPAQVKADPLK